MILKIKLTNGTYFFVDKVSLSLSEPMAEVDLETKSDSFVATIINNVCFGKISVNQTLEALVGLIKDSKLQVKMAKKAGVEKYANISTSDPVTDDNVQTSSVPQVVQEANEPVSEPDKISKTINLEDVLVNLLDGSAKKVSENISAATLTKENLEYLLLLEETGKDRLTVKTFISGLLA